MVYRQEIPWRLFLLTAYVPMREYVYDRMLIFGFSQQQALVCLITYPIFVLNAGSSLLTYQCFCYGNREQLVRPPEGLSDLSYKRMFLLGK